MANSKIKDYIKEKRDTLSASSLTTYASILKNLYTKVFSDNDFDMKKFEDTKKVLEYLKDVPPNKRKTTLSALVIITNSKEYRDEMLSDVRSYNADISKQVKTDTQEENWIDHKEIINTITDYKNNATLLYKKKSLTPSDLQQIQNYIILCVVSGMYISPRRSKDWTDFRIGMNIDKNIHNFIEKNNLVFTSYKTAKAYGRQDIALPPALKKILNKWVSVNPTDYLFFDINFKPLTSVKLNQRLNKIFGKKISTSMLRHFFLTDEFSETISQKKKINKVMEEMGSSSNMLTTYVKNDD